MKDLVEEVELLGATHDFTKLVIKQSGSIDPDDAFSSVPYEKGFALLYHLQTLLGVSKFENFLRGKNEIFHVNFYQLYKHISRHFRSKHSTRKIGKIFFSSTSPVRMKTPQS